MTAPHTDVVGRADAARHGRLDGWRVLVPRAASQAGELSARLRHYGAVPWPVATIAVEPPSQVAPLDRAIGELNDGGYRWVAFTSTNAVRAVAQRLRLHGLDVQKVNTAKVAAVGDRTAAALSRLGVRVDLVPDGEQSAEGLLRSWPSPRQPEESSGRVLLPRSDIARDTLVDGLTEQGWECEPVVAYRTVAAAPPPAEVVAAISGGRFEAVTFTSSSTVRTMLAIATPPPSTVIAAIGRQTARTAREHGLRVHVIARTPSAAGLAAALARYAVGAGHPDLPRDAATLM